MIPILPNEKLKIHIRKKRRLNETDKRIRGYSNKNAQMIGRKMTYRNAYKKDSMMMNG